MLRSSLAMACVLLAWGSARAEKDRLEVGEEVAVFTLKVVNPEDSGETFVSIDSYYGGSAKSPKKAILLSFFATYCEPCKREMPYLAAMYDTYRDKGLQILLISIDKEEEKVQVAKDLAKQHNVKFPVLSDRFNIVAKRYFISKLPCVYLVNGEGKVAMVNVGYSDDISKNLLEQVRRAIGESTSDPIPPALAAHMGGHKPADSVAPAEAAPSGDEAKAAPADEKGGDDDANSKKKGKKRGKRGKPAKKKK